ncbi:hypothetical protein [Desulfonatronum parangueonense]
MKIDVDGLSTVVVGAWNSRIFNPNWLTEHLTKSVEITVEMPFGNPTLPPRMRFDGIKLIVTHNKLVTQPDDSLDESIKKSQQIAMKSVQILGHTPITATGFNYQFIEEDINDKLAGFFNLNDIDDLSDNQALIIATEIKRGFLFNDKEIYLTFQNDSSGKIIIHVNVHKDVKGSHEALEFLSSHDPIILKDEILSLLDNVYNLKLE